MDQLVAVVFIGHRVHRRLVSHLEHFSDTIFDLGDGRSATSSCIWRRRSLRKGYQTIVWLAYAEHDEWRWEGSPQ